MARPKRDIVEYFPHDSRASEGDTLTILESQFGNNGYAFWFKLLEKLAATDGHTLNCNNGAKWQLLCARAHSTPEQGITIVEKLAELQAIDQELWKQKIIWSQNLVDNVAEVYRNRRRDLPKRPILTCNNAPPTTETPNISTSHNPQSRVKESRVKESKYIVVLPDWINKENWDGFLEMRAKQRAAPTIKAQELIIKDLEKFKEAGDDPNEVLNQSTKNGWKGVFSLKGGGNGKTRAHSSQRGLPEHYTDPASL